MNNIIKKRRNKRRNKRKLRILFLITIIVCIGISYSLAYRSPYKATKIENTKSPAKKKLLADPLPTATIKEHNQINDDGISSESALVNDGKKTAYLTFDDGPSVTVTPRVLDVLKRYKVNATFFLIGNVVDSNEQSKNLVRRTFKEGNAIGNHTYTHDLKKLYPHNIIDVPHFMTEVDETENSLRNVLGSNFNTELIRMPGGTMSRKYYKDPNLNLLFSKFHENSVHAIDWNALSSDAEGGKKNSSQLLNSLINSIGLQNKVIILMHDTYGKEQTAKALPKIIEYLKAKGYEFKTLK